MSKNFVFRNVEDACEYKVVNENCPDGYFINRTLFGDEPQQKILGERVCNPEERKNFHYVHRTTLPVGGKVGEHPHVGNEQFYLVMEGEGIVTLCGEEFPVKPWSIALIRSGGSHGIRNTGSMPLTYVCVETSLAAEEEKSNE